jgi:hypothetical protein
MGCGCGKKKCEGSSCGNNQPPVIVSTPNESLITRPIQRKNTFIMKNDNEQPEFKNRTVEPANSIVKGVGMAKSFISSIASKGINNEKVTVPLKQLRVLSCFGNKDTGGQLPPCEYLKKSETEGRFFCGGCGCGDKKLTWLNSFDEEYSKLDYPKLGCPLQMPGFTNYKESSPEESISPVTRRAYIEKLNYDQIKDINVSMPEKID